MSEIELPNYADISDQIQQMQLGVDAAELHGSLCGYLSGSAITVPSQLARPGACPPPDR